MSNCIPVRRPDVQWVRLVPDATRQFHDYFTKQEWRKVPGIIQIEHHAYYYFIHLFLFYF